MSYDAICYKKVCEFRYKLNWIVKIEDPY